MLRTASSRESGIGIALVAVLTAGSMIHIVAPILVTVEKARFRIPANIAVICIIRNTAKVIPINNAENLPLSFTSSLNPIRRMPLYFIMPPLCPPDVACMIESCSWHSLRWVWSGGALLRPYEYIHQLARIDRSVLFLEPENHRQHPQIHFLLALIRQLDLGRNIRLHPDELQRHRSEERRV